MNDETTIGIGKRSAAGACTADEESASLDKLIKIADRVGGSALSERRRMLSARLAEVADAPGAVAALTIKLADAEAEALTQAQNAETSLERALLAESRERYWRDKYEEPFTSAALIDLERLVQRMKDRGHTNDANLLERRRAAIRHDREHAGKLETRVRVLTAERDQARELADQADGYLRRAENAEQDLGDMTHDKNQAEAAYEGCLIERDTARDIAALFRETLGEARGSLNALHKMFQTTTVPSVLKRIDATLETTPGDMEIERAIRRSRDEFIAEIHKATPNGEYVEVQHHPDGDWSVCSTPAKPRCRVVTSPRFYGEAERDRAVDTLVEIGIGMPSPDGLCAEAVDCVAEALGMRRAKP